MIEFKTGDLFRSGAQALVNPVNCAGTMGKGLALEFKERYPDNFREYLRACRQGRVQPGKMLVFKTYAAAPPHYIINFPTKRHWRDFSRLDDLRQGVRALAGELEGRRIRSAALPALGCGLGGLPWPEVKAVLEAGLVDLEDIDIAIYEPGPRRRAATGLRASGP